MRFPAFQGILVLLVVLLASPARSHATKDACYGADVVLKPEESRWRSELWFGVSAGFGGKLPADELAPAELAMQRLGDGCNDLERASLEGKLSLAERLVPAVRAGQGIIIQLHRLPFGSLCNQKRQQELWRI